MDQKNHLMQEEQEEHALRKKEIETNTMKVSKFKKHNLSVI